MLLLRKSRSSDDVEQAALIRGQTFGTPASGGDSVPSRVAIRMRPGRSVTSMRPSGQEGERPGMDEAGDNGFDANIAGRSDLNTCCACAGSAASVSIAAMAVVFSRTLSEPESQH